MFLAQLFSEKTRGITIALAAMLSCKSFNIFSVFSHAFENGSETRQIWKNVSFFSKIGNYFLHDFKTQNQVLAYHLLSYCKTTVSAYVTKDRHLQQFCCKPLNRGSFPFPVIETKAELKSTIFYFHFNCSVVMT